jgi:hypothetical protein
VLLVALVLGGTGVAVGGGVVFWIVRHHRRHGRVRGALA